MNEKLLVEIILRCNFKPFFYNFIQLGIRIFLHDHIKRVSVYKWNVIINNIVLYYYRVMPLSISLLGFYRELNM